MAKSKGLLDQYPQTVTIRVTEAVVTDGAIVQVPSSYSMRDRVGMEILGYSVAPFGPDAWEGYLVADEDYLGYGLSHLFRGGTIPAITEPTGMIDYGLKFCQLETQTAVGFQRNIYDCVDRISFPQPIIAHPASLWVWCQMFAGAAPLDIVVRVNYRLIDITDSQWQELFESILIRDTI